MATLVGSLLVSLGLDSAQFKSGLSGAEKQLARATKSFEKMGTKLQGFGTNLTLGVTAPLAAFGVTAVKAAMESADAMAQVEASLKSMGDAAGLSRDQLAKLASDEMRASLFDDDEILRKVTASMLTFGNVAGDQFKRAQAAAIDLSAKLGTDLQSASLMVGKALNDPVKGITALSRAGIQFTDSQKEAIKSMVALGDSAGAQRIMLAELEKQFGGSAEAARKANPAAAMKQSFAELQENIGEKLLPIFERLTVVLGKMADAFGTLSPAMQTFVVGAGLFAAALGPVLIGVGALVKFAAPLLGLFSTVGGLMASTGTATGGFAVALAAIKTGLAGVLAALSPLLVPLAAVAAVGALIWANWDKISPVLNELWATLQATLGPAFSSLIETVTSTLTALWNGPLGAMLRTVMSALGELLVMFLKVFGPVLVAAIGVVANAFTGFVEFVGGGIRIISALLQGDFSGAWEAAKQTVVRVANAMLGIITSLTGMAPEKIRQMVAAIGNWIGNKLTAIWNGAISKIKEVVSWFDWMDNEVVRNSYVPDMVDGIAAEMARLDKVMVDPAAKAADSVVEKMRIMAEKTRELLANLFPEQAALRDYKAKLKEIDAQPWSAEMKDEAKLRAYESAENSLNTPDIHGDAARNPMVVDYDVAEANAFAAAAEMARDAVEGQNSLLNDMLPKLVDLRSGWEKIADTLNEYAGAAFDAVASNLESVILGAKSFGDAIRDVTKQLASMAMQALIWAPLKAALGIPGFANGTNFAPGGLAMVGERGPELVNLPRGSQVFTNQETRGMLGKGGGGSSNQTFHLSFPNVTNASEARQSALQATNVLRRELNRRY